MDGLSRFATRAPAPVAAFDTVGTPRSFLFLQGPISDFFDRLGRALIARGHRVHRVNLHLGDQLFWRLPATNFRGTFEEWRCFVGALLDRERVTDVVLHGDRRPYHIVAAEEARARGIPVIATDLGYLRPDWITLEYDGMTTYSRFPRDPAAIRALAANFPRPELGPRFHTPFWLIASRDVAYNFGLVLGRVLYPHYRYHSTCHPFVEYAGWLRSRPKKLLTARATAAAKRRLTAEPGSYFLVPLQLTTDFQIRAHSRYADLRDAVGEIVASFAASGSRRKLVFVIHPLDNGVVGWHRLVSRLARRRGIEDRVFTLHGGTPVDLLRGAAGVVTVNSTVGVTALCNGVAVKVLGNAVFDVPGLTCQAPLDGFWTDPAPPDRELFDAFLRALVGTTQIKGGYYERNSQDCAIAGFVERLEQRPYPLPPPDVAERTSRAPRKTAREAAIVGISDALGIALARRFAEPGTRLHFYGWAPPLLAQAAEDCSLRGAAVQEHHGPFATANQTGPLDLVVVGGGHAAAANNIAAAASRVRRRRGGVIVVVGDGVASGAAADPRAALHARPAVIGAVAALRRQLRDDGVAVTAVVPGRIGLWLSMALGASTIASDLSDRIAGQMARAVRRRRRRVASPALRIALARAARLLPVQVWAASRRLLPALGSTVEAAVDTAPLADESATGD